MSKKNIVQPDPRKTLKQRREELGLSCAEVAKKIGVLEQDIRAWEDGDYYPNVLFLPMIEDVLKCDRQHIRWEFEPRKDRVLKEGDPDGETVRVRLVVLSEATITRLNDIPKELADAIEKNDKKRALTLVEELSKATCFLGNP